MTTRQALPLQSALLSFAGRNIRSYRDDVHFSLLATRFTRAGVGRRFHTLSSKTPVEVLPAAGVLGANASGKSTLLLALADMRAVVVNSFRAGTRLSGVYRRPFALDDTCRMESSKFEVEIILDRVHWQYGFEIDDDRVLGEYAYHYPKGRQALVFDRTGDDISFGPAFRASGRVLRPLVRDNALLLSVAGAADDEHLGPLFTWFLRNLLLARSSNRGSRTTRTAELVRDPQGEERVMDLVRAADLGICGIERATVDPEVADRLERALRVIRGEEGDPETSDIDINIEFADSVRLKHSGSRGDVELDPEFESAGTMVWVGLIGPVLDVLDGGHVLLADELDTSLHPYLVSLLIEMFQDPVLNPRCAQIVFNTHDVGILGDSLEGPLGRDQIWFSEKDLDSATSIYPLVDFRPRRDEAIGRRYLQGRFGAVPVIDRGELKAGLDLVDT